MIREKKYITKDFMEIEIFNLPKHKRPYERARRKTESTPKQKNLNDKKAKRYFVRLVHNNFTEKDLYVDLTYTEENLPATREAVIRDIKNYIKRLNRARKKEGRKNARYIYVVSNMDNMGNKKRYHVHMILDDMDRDLAEKKWAKGYANTDRLEFNDHGVTGKSLYMTRQTKGTRSWSCSNGLKKPEAIISDKHMTRATVERIKNSPDDRKYIEKLFNQKKKHDWILTDCTIEEDGRQLMFGQIESEHMGTSILIRMRKYPKQKQEKNIRTKRTP